MKNKVKQFIATKRNIVKEVQEYITDKQITFSDRYEVFKLSSSILPINSWFMHVASFEKAFGDEYYEVYFWNRGEAKTWEEIFEYISKREDVEGYFNEDRIPTDKMIPIIEDVMAEGFAGFTFDW